MNDWFSFLLKFIGIGIAVIMIGISYFRMRQSIEYREDSEEDIGVEEYIEAARIKKGYISLILMICFILSCLIVLFVFELDSIGLVVFLSIWLVAFIARMFIK